ncbi:PREDICTED: uncharacterized protein LOC109192680 [Ipomoea nil]|uniref:uncharacterized protein LOC109192680 n=1 Tax=Ipomoea nil TaxID=35883 RepID=UPI000901AF3C|nr:PREDICTED: uncharacterized protein LOC109192680 [Ipomoea nil]
MQTLSEALLHNNHPVPPPQPAGHRDIGRLMSGHRPPTFAGEEDPIVLEEWRSGEWSLQADLWWIHEGPACLEEPGFYWTALKDRMRERFYPAHVRAAIYEEFLHLQQGSSSMVEYHKKFLELARFARMLVPTELAKAKKFVAGLNYEARKALTVSRPRSLKEAYLSAADLYRVQQLQRGSYELARKRTKSGGSSNFKRPKQNFQAKNAPPPSQGPTRAEPRSQAWTFPCRRCGKEHAGKDCHGQAFRCFRCGDRGHKIAECPQQANQRALPPSTGSGGASGGSSSRGAAGARPSG